MDIIKTEPESYDVSSPTSQLTIVHDVQCQDSGAALRPVVKSEKEVSVFINCVTSGMGAENSWHYFHFPT
jgi:hypothetical protein